MASSSSGWISPKLRPDLEESASVLGLVSQQRKFREFPLGETDEMRNEAS